MADAQVVEALERLVTAAVGLTTVVLGEAGVASELTLPQWRILVVVAESDGSRVGEVAGRNRGQPARGESPRPPSRATRPRDRHAR